MTLNDVTNQVVWLRMLLVELGFEEKELVSILMKNRADTFVFL